MATIKAEIRSGAYYDSVVLMQLQRMLADLPGVVDAGVLMGTPANKALLAQSGLLVAGLDDVTADDLIVSVRAKDEVAAQAALDQVDGLLSRRRSQLATTYNPKSLDVAARMLPAARWVLVSVPGRYAAAIAHQALNLGKNVFLYSDNVAIEDEVALKRSAAGKGLMVMGPDCGTAIVNGVGLGFANRVRRGNIGLVGASGTGLQLITSRIHQLGGGITHALGTGGRDLSEQAGAITVRQGLDLLARDPATEVIVLISKPPAPVVASDVLAAVRSAGKPVVVNFIGFESTAGTEEETWGRKGRKEPGELHFAHTLDETAEIAVNLATTNGSRTTHQPIHTTSYAIDNTQFSSSQRYLRGLFSGGTLAYEALLLLQGVLPDVHSNAPLKGGPRLVNPHRSQGHTIVDLGEDEFTVGRLHPMLDNALRIRRLQEEAEDPETAVILLDVVLGDGAHPDPAGELAPAVERVLAAAKTAGRHLAVVAVVVGTDEDPQDMKSQIEQLEKAGVHVFTRNDEAIRVAGGLVTGERQPAINELSRVSGDLLGDALRTMQPQIKLPPVDLSHLTAPFAAINIGLEAFTQSLADQDESVVHVDWRPPAGGNEKLMEILARMKRRD